MNIPTVKVKYPKLMTELTVKRLIAETINEGLMHVDNLKKLPTAHATLMHGEDMAANAAANILASILPGVCTDQVRMTLDSINQPKEMWWAQGVKERDIELFMEKVYNQK